MEYPSFASLSLQPRWVESSIAVATGGVVCLTWNVVCPPCSEGSVTSVEGTTDPCLSPDLCPSPSPFLAPSHANSHQSACRIQLKC